MEVTLFYWVKKIDVFVGGGPLNVVEYNGGWAWSQKAGLWPKNTLQAIFVFLVCQEVFHGVKTHNAML